MLWSIGRGKSLWMMPMSLRESRLIRLSSYCSLDLLGLLHGAEFNPYIGLTKNSELGAGDTAVIGLVKVHRLIETRF